MNASIRIAILTSFIAAAGVQAISSAQADPLIENGGFESGFSFWTRFDQLGSDGTFFLQNGTSSPVNGDTVPSPPEGSTAAMTDAAGPGSHVLYQDFVVPAGSATLSFDMFIGNRADRFESPATLDFATPLLNQQARVDIMRGGSDPFSVDPLDVLLVVYQSKPGDPLVSGYFNVMTDLSGLFAAHLGETLRLRFADTDNLAQLQLGVDNVSIGPTSVPEPASTLLFGAAWAALLVVRARRGPVRSPNPLRSA